MNCSLVLLLLLILFALQRWNDNMDFPHVSGVGNFNFISKALMSKYLIDGVFDDGLREVADAVSCALQFFRLHLHPFRTQGALKGFLFFSFFC